MTIQTPASDPAAPVVLRTGGYRVYPFVLCRVAGQPFSTLGTFRFPASREQHLVLELQERELDRARQHLEESFHQAVGAVGEDHAKRRVLLRAARNLRRHHKLSEAQEAALRTLGPASLIDAVGRWRGQQALVGTHGRQLETIYERELLTSRRALRALAQEKSFLQGLVLSTPILYRSFEQSLERRLEEIPYHRTQRRLEQSLLKYLTRAAAKTTPFSTLTATVPAELAGQLPGGPIRLPDDPAAATAVILNKALYSVLYRLLKATPELYPCFAVTLNPSLHQDREGYAMLLARDGREQDVRLPASPAVECSVELIREAGGTLPYGEFVGRLGDEFEVAWEEIRGRVDRMVDVGFLQLNSGIADSEQNWAPRLRERLVDSIHPLARVICRLLEQGRQVVEEFGASPAAHRAALLARWSEQIEGLVRETSLEDAEAPAVAGAPEGAAEPERRALDEQLRILRKNPLHEDAALAGPVLLDTPRLLPALRALGDWVEWVSLLSLKLPFQASLREFFTRRFGDAEEVAFPVFYREFFSDVFEDVLQFERGVTEKDFNEVANPFGLDVLSRVQEASVKLTRTVQRLWAEAPAADNLRLRRDHLEAADVRPLRYEGPTSAMVFAQVVPASALVGEDALLIDKQAVFGGMGKYFSRFLPQFDERITRRLRAHNTRHRGTIVAELCDDSEFSFNANLHPPLTDAEINYPANITGLQPSRNLALADLVVRPDVAHRNRLQLFHRPSGKEVLPVDLGFLNPLRRPPLFRVLALFSPVFSHQFDLPWSQNGSDPESGEVRYRPRVLFEDRLVLSRRSWWVAAGALRERLAGTTPARAFQRLNRWRTDLGMPADVFFRAMPTQPKREDESPEKDPDAPRDDSPVQAAGTQKPQYLSFESGFLTEMLCEAVRNHDGAILFEEMLPAPDMLSELRRRPYVTEFVLQLDRDPDSCG
ncbi:MAG: hypothetical protein GY856_07130 [bacterium]|nr:hypothetical protein [bacterium]